MPDPHDDIRGRAFWSGTITFGLVSIPVALFPGNRARNVRLRMLAPDGTPLARRYFCPREDRPIRREEIVRGYEVEAGRFITVLDDELDALQPKKSREIDLRRFVPARRIDPKFFDRAYFLVPAGDSHKPYRLLAETMEQTGRAGIATFVMRGKEYLVAILAENGILRAETLRFADEIRAPADVGLPEPAVVPEPAVDAMVDEIRAASAEAFEPDELRDDYAEKLLALVEAKRAAGRDVVRTVETPAEEDEDEGKVIDLMEVLKRSMAVESRGDDRRNGPRPSS